MNARFILAGAILIALSCAKHEAPVAQRVPTHNEPAAATTQTTRQTSPSAESINAPPEAQRNITIDSVDASNPVVMRGRARTFENHVAVRVRDAKGAVIAEGFTIATGDSGVLSPYTATIWLTSDPGARITAEALEYSARDGSEQSLVAHTSPFNVPLVTSALFFSDSQCTATKAYERRMPKSVAMARLLVEALLRGPSASERKAGATSPFPAQSGVRSVILRDGTLTVDFNERLQNVGGSCAAQMIRKTVEQTLSRLPSVHRVVMTAAGSQSLALQP